MTTAMATRVECDAFGAVEVPADRYWGAQTQRALAVFTIGDVASERLPTCLVRTFGLHKLAAARANRRLGELPPELAEPIEQAAHELWEGRFDDHFPLPVWQTGSGTQTNMNANEVIANRANELLGAPLGGRSPVHPNDHVNRGQSSNDSFPTVMHIVAVLELQDRLLPALGRAARLARGQGRRLRRRDQDRPHASAGCGADDHGPGVRRLRSHRSSSGSSGSRRACRGSTRWHKAAPRSAPASTP